MKIPEDERPGRDLGKRRLRAVAKSLVRAGIKLIPLVGPSLDEVVFGPGDELAKQDLTALIQEVAASVRDMSDRYGNESSLERIVFAELHREDSRLSALAEEFAALSPAGESLLSRWLLTTARPRLSSTELENLHGAAPSLLEEVSEVIIGELRYSEADVVERLEKIESYLADLAGADFSKVPEVTAALHKLGEGPASQRLMRRAQLLSRQVLIEQELRHFRLSTDFSVLYDYAHAFSEPSADLHHIVYLIESSRSPIWLLPGTIVELRTFLNRLTLDVIGGLGSAGEIGYTPSRSRGMSMALHESQSLLALLLGESTSPLTRLLRLMRSGQVAPWPDRNPEPEYERDLESLFTMLNEMRPGQVAANYADAVNLATLAVHNRVVDKARTAKVAHLTGGSMLKTVCHRSGLSPLMVKTEPVAFTAAEYSIQTYIQTRQTSQAHKSSLDLARLGVDASRIAQLDSFARRAEGQVRGKGDLGPLLADVAELQNSAAAVYLFFGPFFDVLTAVTEETLGAVAEALDERNELNRAYDIVMRDLTELFGYVEEYRGLVDDYLRAQPG